MGMTFDLKDGYCHIEGKCVQNGTLSLKQTLICDTRAARFRWTMVPTTTQAPVTANKAMAVSGDTDLVVVILSTVGAVLVIIIFVLVLVICCKRKKDKNRSENLRHTNVQNEYSDVNSLEMVHIPRAKHYLDGKIAHDNPTFQYESIYSEMADTTLDSSLQSVYKEGSYCESKDGYVYYFGKKY
ncbi:uncharacterized protein LOC128550265 [Mercenaria mercenaria]|uniref:uncharacterized protein LOC128550265 n=1 Tax=Mercenaria mercenaria TaxID=6596 RepID=UPI00234F4F49|nr:uncharacterized protein LOC128550265 [Mercenaria mercenaria]